MTGLPDGARLGSAGRDGSAGGGRGLPNLPNQKTSAAPRLCAFALKSILAVLVFGLAVCARADMAEQVRLDMFFSAGCTECERVKREVLPELEAQYEGFYDLVGHDLLQPESVPLLVAYQERCGNRDNGRVSIIVDHTVFLSGYDAIATGLFDRVNAALVARQDPAWQAPRAPDLADDEADAVVRRTVDGLTFSVVALGGLLDGFNPCAVSTLIFFMSVLAVAKASRRTRLLVGVSFITASFFVYMGLGLGFLYVFRQAPNFATVKKVVEVVLGLCMIPLAVLSFRDAIRFRKSQRPDDVTLQIPKTIKTRIHGFMNSRLGMGGPILGGLVTGAGVTVLESVCTGQSYVPVLMYMLKKEHADLCTWCLLVIYNLLFVLPLAAVFVCFHRGMQLTALIDWSKRNLVVVKILLGLFFSAMAVLLLLA
jgi:cytochrome c biogenesis protein CcdA